MLVLSCRLYRHAVQHFFVNILQIFTQFEVILAHFCSVGCSAKEKLLIYRKEFWFFTLDQCYRVIGPRIVKKLKTMAKYDNN